MTDWDKVRHFSRDEFGYAGDVEPSRCLVAMLDEARHIAGVPFVITSGIRSEADNYRVGGVKSSAHLTGHAVDIACPDSVTRHKIIKALNAVHCQRYGVGESFIHVDVDPDKPSPRVWLYK